MSNISVQLVPTREHTLRMACRSTWTNDLSIEADGRNIDLPDGRNIDLPEKQKLFVMKHQHDRYKNEKAKIGSTKDHGVSQNITPCLHILRNLACSAANESQAVSLQISGKPMPSKVMKRVWRKILNHKLKGFYLDTVSRKGIPFIDTRLTFNTPRDTVSLA
ncbi:hypothetical protein MKW98_006220 [Papaver atlanticum]|uniref:Uncharacterized protein n=1 Tax=Papaver atlanticum TaxID=357466 RepID=A0AAD4TH31_9MAGN|nr:hypothetical protein MKW98_006220 [Papaver atlanticum]